MRLFAKCLVIGMVVLSTMQTSPAAERPSYAVYLLSHLPDFYLIKRISKKLGGCEQTVLPRALELTCDNNRSNRRGPVLVRIDVAIIEYVRTDPMKKYLSDRKRYCLRLASLSGNRCVGTDGIRPRFSLHGFRSSSREKPDVYRHEYVVFNGREVIRATVLGDLQTIDHDLDGWLQWTLARLTPLW